jgi:hypothetical protein
VLLYWDRVGTILPMQYAKDRVFLRPYASALLSEGLLVPIPPNSSVWRTEATNYFAAFLNLVDSDPLQVGTASAIQREWTRVHLDKTGSELALALVGRDLAKQPTGPPPQRGLRSSGKPQIS